MVGPATHSGNLLHLLELWVFTSLKWGSLHLTGWL